MQASLQRGGRPCRPICWWAKGLKLPDQGVSNLGNPRPKGQRSGEWEWTCCQLTGSLSVLPLTVSGKRYILTTEHFPRDIELTWRVFSVKPVCTLSCDCATAPPTTALYVEEQKGLRSKT